MASARYCLAPDAYRGDIYATSQSILTARHVPIREKHNLQGNFPPFLISFFQNHHISLQCARSSFKNKMPSFRQCLFYTLARSSHVLEEMRLPDKVR